MQTKVIDARRPVEAHLPVSAVGFLLGRSKRWVMARIRAGELEGYQLDRGVVVTAASVNSFLRRVRVSPTPDGEPQAEG